MMSKRFYNTLIMVIAIIVIVPVAAVATSVSDFRVHAEDVTGTAQQNLVSASGLTDGNYVVTWLDRRDKSYSYSYNEWDAYYQVYSADGNRIGDNRKVMADRINSPIEVAMWPDGSFIVAYERSDIAEVRSFDVLGNPVGGPVSVSEGHGTKIQICSNNQGHAMIGFSVFELGFGDRYYGQYYDQNDGLVGGNFAISGDIPLGYYVDMAITDADWVCVAYSTNYRESDQAIGGSINLAQMVFPSPPSSGTIPVDEGYTTEELKYNTMRVNVASHPSGYQAAIWIGYYYERTGPDGWSYLTDTTFVTLYDPAGNPVSERLPIMNRDDMQGYEHVLVPVAGGFKVAIADYYDNRMALTGFSLGGVVEALEIRNLTENYLEDASNLCLAGQAGGNITLAWLSESSSPSKDAVAQEFALGSSLVFPAEFVNTDIGSEQSRPVITTNNSGKSLVVWNDKRNTTLGELYGRVLDVDGYPQGSDFLIHACDKEIYGLKLASHDTSYAVAVWCTQTYGGLYDLNYQVFNMPNYVLDGPVVTEHVGSYAPIVADVEVTSFSAFIAFRRENSSGVASTFYMFLDLQTRAWWEPYPGVKINESEGQPLLADDDLSYAPSLDRHSNGTIAISWMEPGQGPGGEPSVMVQQFYSDVYGYGMVGNNIDLLGDMSDYSDFAPDNRVVPEVAISSDNRYGVIWQKEGTQNILFRTISGINVSDPEVVLSKSSSGSIQMVGGPSSNFLACLADNRYGNMDIHAQRINASSGPVGSPMLVNSDPSRNTQEHPSVAATYDQVMFVWEDYREELGLSDIYARIEEWDILGPCCGKYTAGLTGNADCSGDGMRDLADITRLIDRVYISKAVLCCEQNGNVDGDSELIIDLADITRLIDHIYISKTETAVCN